MKWIQYKLHTTTDAVEIIGELLYEQGIQGFEISDNIPPSPEEEKRMYTDIPAKLLPDDGTAVITFYTEGENKEEEREFYSTGSSLRDEQIPQPAPPADPAELVEALRQRIHQMQEFNPFPEPQIEYSVQDDSLWKDTWKDSFQAFRASEHLIVKPVWEDVPAFARKEDILLQINPGSAFGTGTHETTKLCILSLEKYIHRESVVLDAGCGSGILAIASLLLGARSALCLDIDSSAVTSTIENAAHNNIADNQIQAIQANILQESDSIEALTPDTFDIVLANILADVIIPLCGIVSPFLKKDGLLICSGILTQKAGEVREALLQNHYHIIEENELGEWICFTARKGNN